ncbi:hypothetical protein D3C78_1242870 [compost metagenome]
MVVQEAAPVEVGRADRGPHAVDHRGLHVQQGVTVFVQLDAGLQQLAVGGATGVQDQPRIGMAGQQQPDVDAARHRLLERRQQLRVGHEVGVGQPDFALRAAQCRDQRDVDQAVGVFRRAADGAHHLVALAFERRKVGARRQRRAFLLLPGVDEQLLQLGDHRPLDAQVGVAPGRRAAGPHLGMLA